MNKRIVLLGAATLTLIAGCTGTATRGTTPATTSPSPTQPATQPSTPPSAQPSTPSSTAAPAPSVPAATRQVAWASLVKPCPHGLDVRIEKIIRADVTGDGKTDTVVARTCEAVTSYWPYTVEIFQGTHRFATLLEEFGAIDYPLLKTMRVSGGKVVIQARGVGRHGSAACPDEQITYVYEHYRDGFRLISRRIVDFKDCQQLK